MALIYSNETAGLAARPVVKPAGNVYGGRMRRYRATVNLTAQANADWIWLLTLPAGSAFAFGVLTASVSLGTSVIAIGTSPTHATNGQYRAAGTFTSADTPTMFGLTAAVGAAAATADTVVYLTSATAALPAAGTLVVDIYASNG